jgi:type VI secretion system secreted protein VgrG
MSVLTQENRLIGIHTPLGEDVVLLKSFQGVEGISQPFTYHLELLSLQKSIEFDKLLGQKVTIRITLADGSERYINGHVSRFAQLGAGAQFTSYRMEVVPWLWFLTRITDCRIFQNKTIPEIIEEVFKSRNMKDFKSSVSSGSFEKREYCVQYRETDFAFVSRLMEQYGIFYYFEHDKDRHTLVMADSASSYKPCPGQPKARYNLTVGDLDMEDVVTGWQLEQELRTGKYSLTDYNFETPSANLAANEPSVVKVGGNDQFERYDYPGDYLNQADGREVAKIRMQERETGHLVAKGTSVCRSLASGYTLTLEEHPTSSMNQKYLLTGIEHEATVGDSYASDDAGGAKYSNGFFCIPVDEKLPFRPPLVTPRPFVHGPQTALVVGPKGEEIFVDKYGRVKVQFYWDRQGEKNDKSSCWIRVSQAWAGKNWGAMWIPRIGQEVIVDFLEGDPDRPIITGRVYNAEQMPPYDLPDNGTRSTFMSRSSKNGGTHNANEIRFEDKKGDEQIFINAERDMDLRVEADSREFVGGYRHLIVKKDQTESVDGGLSQTVGGDQKEDVGGGLHVNVGGSRNEKVGAGMSLDVGTSLQEKTGTKFAHQAGTEIHLKAGMTVVIEAGVELTLKASGSFVNIGPAGVAIQGTMVLINSGGAAGAGSGSSPESPEKPEKPDEADDGSKGGKM